MHRIALATALLLGLTTAQFEDVKGKAYQKLSASQKMSRLWAHVQEDTTPAEYPNPIALGGIFLESMEPSFDVFEDILPEDRDKLIHSQGVTAKVAFYADAFQPYSGLFKGAEEGLLRFSAAKAYDTSRSKPEEAKDNFAPGIGVKFLRDGMYSGNFVAMFGVNGQESWNPFFHDFSNHIPEPEGVALRTLAQKFASATDFVRTVGLQDFAKFDQHGNEDTPHYPFKLVLKPNPSLRSKFSDHFEKDFKDQLKTIPSGTDLYEVFAQDQPTDKSLTRVGSIVLKSPFTTSLFADENLFIQHWKMEVDLKDHPEWTKYTPKWHFFGSEEEATGGCPFKNFLGL